MTEFLQANWADILWHIAQHLWLVFISIAVAVAIALPVGILISRRKRLRGPVLGIANVMQTIPSLALFGFLIPLPFIGGIGPPWSFTRSCRSFETRSPESSTSIGMFAKPPSPWA